MYRVEQELLKREAAKSSRMSNKTWRKYEKTIPVSYLVTYRNYLKERI